ncbi:chondroitinase-B domain-containing protein [Pseudocolwellia sp. HL-MZ7]|uniref:chondroitinase-B domain-containing protein n=1 Tax=Pseudocolwellia sp. HL-MZ7 TaxID=3400627 RepID=UPI003CF4CA25
MQKNKQTLTKKLALGILVGSLSACGGGGDDAVDPVVDPVVDPIVPAEVTNVAAVISGGMSGTATEDVMIDTSGTLSVVDPDSGEDAFVVQTDIQGDYGTFSIDASGAWTYSLDHTDTNVQALTAADTVTDTFTVTTVDTTSATVTITITGADEVVVVVPPPSNNANGYSQEQGGNSIDGYTDAVPVVNCDTTYDSISALTSAASNSLAAGTTLCLADGNYDDDFELDFGGVGTAEAKITIAAENPGQAVISNSQVDIVMSGEHVVLQGFVFRDGSVDFNLIKTFGNSVPCNFCRITENTIVDMDDGVNDTDDSKKWFEIYGAHTRFDHNWISGKTSRGALLVVDRYSDGWSTSIEADFEVDYAQIDYNYFGDRPPIEGKAYAASSDNEYEGIRIGLSTSHSGDSFSVVENNYFERIQGEAEVISNKATNNTIRNNTVRDSYGSIVTRHGNTATISNNFVLGDDHPFSGGIRIVDDSHIVTNNYIQGARYLASNWNGGIVLTTGDGSGDSENGYQDVSNVLVANNTIVDSVNSLNVYGGNENTAPDSVYFINNIIADAVGAIIRNADEMPTNSIYAGNYVDGLVLSDDDDDATISGFNMVDAMLVADSDGIFRPSASSPSLTAESNVAIGSFTLPTIDIDGQTRSDTTTSGADEVLTTDATLALLSSADVGPKTYTATPGEVHVAVVPLANHDFDSGDFTGWTNNGGVIETDAEEIFSRGASLKLDSNAANVSQSVSVTANTNYTLSAFVKGTAKLSALVGGVTYYSDQDSSSYKFTSVTFNSGSATTAVISGSVDDFVLNEAVSDSDLVEFKAGDGEWQTIEGTNEGDVGGSSNSASGADGSAKLGYNKATHDNTSPVLFQEVDVDLNTNYDFELAMLVKNGSSSSVTVRIEGDSSIILNDTVVTTADLVDTDLDDSFELFSLSGLNSGSNDSATIYITYNAHTIIGDTTVDSDGKLSSDVQKANELRIDNVSFTSQGAPANGTEAYFDSFRLVSHADAPDGYSSNDQPQ